MGQHTKGKTPLSSRLQAIAAMVEEGSLLADIGTDHGYLPIRLLEDGKISGAIAADINRGPLLRAKEHVREKGLDDRISLRLSDGFLAVLPGEADVAVIAGMGGPLTIRILENGKETARALKYLVLSPQSEVRLVRRYLLENGYEILDEDMAEDGGKYYTVIKTAYHQGADGKKQWNYIEEAYGRYLLRSGKPVVGEFLLKEKRTCEDLKRKLSQAGTKRADGRLFEIEERLIQVNGALDLFWKAEGKKGEEF